MWKSLKNIIYTIKETIYDHWYSITHLNDDKPCNIVTMPEHLIHENKWYPGIDRDRAPDNNDFERHQFSEDQRLARMRGISADYRTDFRECRKHDNYVVFYDLKKYFECPKCVEEKERVQIVDFLTESDMNL